jgi:predicted short-subunit dehydrogenase-like oxidoreductase (DUF2520 family)
LLCREWVGGEFMKYRGYRLKGKCIERYSQLNFVYFRKIFLMIQYKISFVGAGKVAGALCMELHNKGHLIQQIVSTGGRSGRSLAKKCNAGWSDNLVFPDSTEIIIVAVPDHRLKEVLGRIKCGKRTIVAHTAGSFGLEVFPETIKNRGVFYPLQTFSKERKADFTDMPVFIESSDHNSQSVLKSLAESTGVSVHFSDTEHRRLLHVAAVFVSNFTNHMFTAGKEVATKAGFSFEVMEPLILETVKKAIELGPENSQTGPAVRNDLNTIEKHLDLLSFSPELRNIYGEMTRAITQYYKKSLKDE